MSDLPKLSVRLHGGIDARRCIDLARAADAAGFDSIWFAENAFNRGVLPAASACAAASLQAVQDFDGRAGEPVIQWGYYSPHPEIAYKFGMASFRKS